MLSVSPAKEPHPEYHPSLACLCSTCFQATFSVSFISLLQTIFFSLTSLLSLCPCSPHFSHYTLLSHHFYPLALLFPPSFNSTRSLISLLPSVSVALFFISCFSLPFFSQGFLLLHPIVALFHSSISFLFIPTCLSFFLVLNSPTSSSLPPFLLLSLFSPL